MLGLFTKAQLCVFGKLTKEHCLASLHMVREIQRLHRRSSPLFLSQYLKTVSLHVMRYWAGEKGVDQPMKVYVSLTRCGIPRIIPPFSRKRLRMRSNPLIVKFIFTICTLYRFILVRPKGSLIDPSTIQVDGYTCAGDAKEVCLQIVDNLVPFLKSYTRGLYSKVPLHLGFRYRPILTSGPNTSLFKMGRDSVFSAESAGGAQPSTWHTLPLDASALYCSFELETLATIGSVLFKDRVHYPTNAAENPVWPDSDSADCFLEFINRLLRVASQVWK